CVQAKLVGVRPLIEKKLPPSVQSMGRMIVHLNSPSNEGVDLHTTRAYAGVKLHCGLYVFGSPSQFREPFVLATPLNVT
ncbi:MAG: hypothetical protein WA485_14005, partial [Candidatus Sulfotelmatobacter sp.]